jgi:transketolase
MCITNRGLKLMDRWLTHPLVREYSLSADWDNRWRTGGSVDEVIEEAHLDPAHILEGIERFVRDRAKRIASLEAAVSSLK